MMRPEMGSPNKKPHASSSTVISLLHSEGMSDNTTGGNHTPTVVTHDSSGPGSNSTNPALVCPNPVDRCDDWLGELGENDMEHDKEHAPEIFDQ